MEAEIASSSFPASIVGQQRPAELEDQRLLRALAVGHVARNLCEAGYLPMLSRMAVMMMLAQKREPSLRTRQPSSSTRPRSAA